MINYKYRVINDIGVQRIARGSAVRVNKEGELKREVKLILKAS
jgi:hypothetical protein